MYIKRVEESLWLTSLDLAHIGYPKIRASVCTSQEFMSKSAIFSKCFLCYAIRKDDLDRSVHVLVGGYAITSESELVGLYSLQKGVGRQLVEHALKLGANHLNCAGIKLVNYYKKFGFYVYKEEVALPPYIENLYYMNL